MIQIDSRPRIGASLLFITVMALMLSGCSIFRSTPSGGMTQPATSPKKKGPSPMYYDFGDVLVPSELKLDRKASFVFQTPSLTAGVLALKGRAEMSSLIRFFEVNMQKDNWQKVSSFKAIRTIMLYRKENRWCVINVTEKSYYTHVEIWVAPTTSESSESGLFKEAGS